jgi:tetratricopeptide (TPR) repeat protein
MAVVANLAMGTNSQGGQIMFRGDDPRGGVFYDCRREDKPLPTLKESIEACQSMLAEGPSIGADNYGDAMGYLADNLRDDHQYQMALGVYKKAYEMHSVAYRKPDFDLNIANCYTQLGEFDLSNQWLDKYGPDYKNSIMGGPLTKSDLLRRLAGYYGPNYLGLKNYPAALKSFQDFQASFPNDKENNDRIALIKRLMSDQKAHDGDVTPGATVPSPLATPSTAANLSTSTGPATSSPPTAQHDDAVNSIKTASLNDWLKDAEKDQIKMAMIFAAGESESVLSRSKALNAICPSDDAGFTPDQYLSVLKVQIAINPDAGKQTADALFSTMLAGLQRMLPCGKQ